MPVIATVEGEASTSCKRDARAHIIDCGAGWKARGARLKLAELRDGLSGNADCVATGSGWPMRISSLPMRFLALRPHGYLSAASLLILHA
jgi:hypothetical protein